MCRMILRLEYTGKSLPDKVVLLEERDATINDENTKSTAKIIDKMIEDNDDRIDQHEVLRARLLDMLIGDWDSI